MFLECCCKFWERCWLSRTSVQALSIPHPPEQRPKWLGRRSSDGIQLRRVQITACCSVRSSAGGSGGSGGRSAGRQSGSVSHLHCVRSWRSSATAVLNGLSRLQAASVLGPPSIATCFAARSGAAGCQGYCCCVCCCLNSSLPSKWPGRWHLTCSRAIHDDQFCHAAA